MTNKWKKYMWNKNKNDELESINQESKTLTYKKISQFYVQLQTWLTAWRAM